MRITPSSMIINRDADRQHTLTTNTHSICERATAQRLLLNSPRRVKENAGQPTQTRQTDTYRHTSACREEPSATSTNTTSTSTDTQTRTRPRTHTPRTHTTHALLHTHAYTHKHNQHKHTQMHTLTYAKHIRHTRTCTRTRGTHSTNTSTHKCTHSHTQTHTRHTHRYACTHSTTSDALSRRECVHTMGAQLAWCEFRSKTYTEKDTTFGFRV